MKKYLFISAFALIALSTKAQTPPKQTKDTAVVADIEEPAAPKSDVSESNIIFIAVENEPTYPGGIDEFMKYVAQHFKFSDKEHQDHAKGGVELFFVVEKDGSLSGIKAVRTNPSGKPIKDPTDDIANEVAAVVATSPKWIPGTQHGKKVRVQYTAGFHFSL